MSNEIAQHLHRVHFYDSRCGEAIVYCDMVVLL